MGVLRPKSRGKAELRRAGELPLEILAAQTNLAGFNSHPILEPKESCGCEFLDLKGSAFRLDLGQVILQLLKQPTLRGGIEGNREPDGHLRADSRPAIQNA
jgi:hypothetical protein